MDRRCFIHLQGERKVSGVLRGFDIFLNLVIDQAFEELGAGERKPCGMIVSYFRPIEWCTCTREDV
jgi:small nuclear ribonucleoprotein G